MFKRLIGKSILAKLLLEQALANGKTVTVVTVEGITIQKKYKHLISITPVKREERKPFLWYGDCDDY